LKTISEVKQIKHATMEQDLSHLVGKRIRVISFGVDPNNGNPEPDPVPSGTEGEVRHTGGGVINVNWDNGRTLGLIHGTDRYVVLT